MAGISSNLGEIVRSWVHYLKSLYIFVSQGLPFLHLFTPTSIYSKVNVEQIV